MVASVAEFGQLFGNSGLYFRMQMTCVQYTDTAGKINVTVTVCVPQFCIFGFFDIKIAHDTHATSGGGQTALGDFYFTHFVS